MTNGGGAFGNVWCSGGGCCVCSIAHAPNSCLQLVKRCCSTRKRKRRAACTSCTSASEEQRWRGGGLRAGEDICLLLAPRRPHPTTCRPRLSPDDEANLAVIFLDRSASGCGLGSGIPARAWRRSESSPALFASVEPFSCP